MKQAADPRAALTPFEQEQLHGQEWDAMRIRDETRRHNRAMEAASKINFGDTGIPKHLVLMAALLGGGALGAGGMYAYNRFKNRDKEEAMKKQALKIDFTKFKGTRRPGPAKKETYEGVVKRYLKPVEKTDDKEVGEMNEKEKQLKAAYDQGFMDKMAEMGMEKWAQSNIPQLGVQSNLPYGKYRDLKPEEESAVEKGKSQWLPKIFKSYQTPIPEMMASPGKQALLLALLGGGVGAGVGALGGGVRGLDRPGDMGKLMGAGALLGGGLGAGVGGIGGYFGRRAENETLEDLMHRMPKGETGRYRNYLADPNVQAALNRQAMIQAAAGWL